METSILSFLFSKGGDWETVKQLLFFFLSENKGAPAARGKNVCFPAFPGNRKVKT